MKGNLLSAPEPDSELIEDDVPPPPKPPRFSKRLVVIAGAVLLLILIGGGTAAYLLLAGGPAKPSAESHEEEGATYVDAPPMVVNLRGADGSARFLKIRFTFVPASAAKGELIKAKLPLIVDAFQPFLRELRPEDLAGSAAVFRIREEMLVRATGAMGPGVVKDILIQDLIQQ
jgi:flagellar FliL protein